MLSNHSANNQDDRFVNEPADGSNQNGHGGATVADSIRSTIVNIGTLSPREVIQQVDRKHIHGLLIRFGNHIPLVAFGICVCIALICSVQREITYTRANKQAAANNTTTTTTVAPTTTTTTTTTSTTTVAPTTTVTPTSTDAPKNDSNSASD
ncbi:mucin TcMUCII [Strigomonas culicis]|uniref:Mucin TcMUCII n=1 Tax=Strigomonas culicis TaxID=28005 RepID=S9UY63_9TRYP|nr:mucin TcMUCII [Strigomonas culicis]|eukprot:EPY15480.1 mucin TcMUCII [Strigomonas culicis]